MIDNDARKGRPCELVDGVLVEKPMGIIESMLAIILASRISDFVLEHNLGIVTGPDGMLRLMPGLVRGPDVAFISWDRLPNRALPDRPVPHLAPDLVVEILSDSNTHREMQRKLQEYFTAGARIVWYIDPGERSVAVFDSANATPARLTSTDTLDATPVLPGFRLSLAKLFAALDRSGNRPA